MTVKDDKYIDMSVKSYEGSSVGKDKVTSIGAMEPMMRSKETSSESDEDHCGLACCHPQSFRRFENLATFTGICSTTALFSHALTVYISSQIPVLERQFHWNSSQSGFIISCNEIGFLMTILLASHFCKNAHIPRFMSLCTLLFGLATLCMFAAYFVRPETAWDSLDSFVDSRGVSKDTLSLEEHDFLCTHDAITNNTDSHKHRECALKERINISRTHAAYAIFIIFMIVQGMAKAPRSSLVPLYVDNNVSDQSKTGFYMGIIFTAQLLGPGVAFGLGGAFSKIPVDLRDHGIDSKDPRWIGAWWLGFLVIGFSSVLGIPLAFFPRSLKKRDAMIRASIESRTSRNEKSELTLKDNIKGLLKSLRNVLKNPVYVLSLLSSTAFFLVVMGLYAFAAKYLEVVFLVSSFKANLIMSGISMVSSTIGTMLGGTISSKLRLTVPSLMKMKLMILSLVLVADITSLFLGCDQPVIRNDPTHKESFRNKDLTHIIKDCNCEHGRYFPVCGSDDVSYFSPCYAGCKDWSNSTFQSCDSINGGHARPGICEKSCGSLYIFMALFFVADLIGTIDIVPTYLIMLRTQYEKDKAVAMGFGSFMLSAFAFLPAPALFGKLVDMACIIWEDNCGVKGSCELYNMSMLRKLLFLPLLSGRLLALLLIIVALCLAVKRTQPGDLLREKVANAIQKEEHETTSL